MKGAFRRRSSISWRDVMRRWTICGALATALLVLIAASATAATLGPTTRVTVKPGSGTPRTRFAFSLRMPVATGRFGTLSRADTLSVTGSPGTNCESRASRALKPAKRGKRVKMVLRPAKSGWCAGRWRGTVLQTESIRCSPTPGRACPDVVVAPRVIASFRFRVKPQVTHSPPTQPSGDVPTFGGLISAVTCPSGGPQPGFVPGPVLPLRMVSYTLTWHAATDPVTPSAQIVYDIFVATAPGAEDFAKATFTTSPGATSFQTPNEPRGTTLYFVVRARNAAGHEDTNKAERQGVVDCPPLNQPARQRAGA
jgi:hypothetical protein